MAQTIKGMNTGWHSFKNMKLETLAHTGIFKLHLEAKATLDSAEVQLSVKLPPGMPEDEWIAAQFLIVFSEVSEVVSLLEDMCTEDSCPKMCAGKHVTYSWADEKNPKPRECSAPFYMQMLVEWAQEKLTSGTIMPQTDGAPFPRDYKVEMGTVLKRFFRVYAHAYLHHFEEIVRLDAEAHMNMYFKHYMAFVREFNLVNKTEFAPMKALLTKWNILEGKKAPCDKDMLDTVSSIGSSECGSPISPMKPGCTACAE